MYDCFLFDLDGTLTDPSVGITNSVKYALDKFGVTVEDESLLLKFIGPPLVEGFRDLCGFSHEDSLKATEYYRETFRVKGIFENQVYDGITEMLESLRSNGKKIVLATSKPEEFAVQIMEHFGLAKYFDFMAGATFDSTRSSKGAVIEYALKNVDLPKGAKVVMVGDRYHDIEGAKQNGIDSIGVLYGFGSKEELESAGADHTVETATEILKFV